MILSRPMTGLPGPEGLSQLQFSMIPGFRDRHQSGAQNPLSSQGLQALRPSKPYQGSVTPEDYDTDMGGTVGGSEPTSPENVANDDGIKSQGNNVIIDKTMVAIPEYFASKKTKDGKIPKKRGPKPDSKPARDRRQELNRQAQRNHRHRKEEQQKWLEEALAEAREKALAAMKHAQEAEQRHMQMTRVYEQSQLENDRLKQLLNVNRIPFARVIPQAAPLSANRPVIPQQHEVITNSTSTTQIPSLTPSSPDHSQPSSGSADTALRDSRYLSSMSPVSSMDGTEEYDEHGSSPQMHSSVQSSSSQQPKQSVSLNIQTSTGPPSSAITGPASALSGMSANYGAQFDMPPFPKPSDPVLNAAYPTSSVASNQSVSPTLVNAPIGTQQSDPFAIKNHDQVGVDFILALEANCHDHKTLMNSRTLNDPVQLGGHSLMLSKVPIDVAKNYHYGDPPHPHGPPDVGEGPGKYARLLSLVNLKPFSTNKNWELRTGEISPAQALGFIRKDPRYAMLNSKDFEEITNVLKDRCRCYGFGAVVEVYEVEDVLNDVFAEKGFGMDDGYGLDNPLWSQLPLSNPHTLDGPEYPALDKLMEFDLAGLMGTRHTDREQFLAADLNVFNVSPNADDPSESHQRNTNEAPFATAQSSQSGGLSRFPTFDERQSTNVNPQAQQGQINPGYANDY